jgi:peptidoglycan/LPS O-acetylase OafA/YrhL
MPAATAPPVVAPPPGNPRFPLMDSLRAIAAFGVLFGHVGTFSHTAQSHAYGAWLANLTAGVCLFFLLSGFLLYRPFVNAQLREARRPTVLDYTRRRILRIVPAYWLALTLLAIYPGLTGLWNPGWWKYYAMLQIYDPYTTLSGLPVAWTLCIEVSFYLLLPFFAVGMAAVSRRLDRSGQVRMQLVVLALLALASIVLRAATDDIVLSNTLPTYFYWFALGMALAVLSVAWQDRELPPGAARWVADHPGICWGIAIGVYLLIGAALTSAPRHLIYSDRQLMLQFVLRGVMAFFLVLPAVFGDWAGGWPRRVLAWGWLAWLGLISYGIYLWHIEIVRVLSDKLDDAFLPVLVGAIVLSIAAAAGSYYVVERPILRFKDWRPGRRKGGRRARVAA